ncbi:hypothetical protein ABZ817_38330 [Streptomyces antimycoticus]|uniref:hypothetical protein n=1 Tax=Streptomyces antimycoticus TaxID=68175 RepID=UPI00340BB804
MDVLAVLSLVIAGGALGWSIRTYRASIKLNRRDLFLSLHEQLSRPDRMRGRSILREEITSVPDAEAIRQSRPGDYELVMSAIIMLDILGLYVKKNYVRKDLVLEEWGWLYGRCFDHGQHVINERQWYGPDRRTRAPWINFVELGKEASERYP